MEEPYRGTLGKNMMETCDKDNVEHCVAEDQTHLFQSRKGEKRVLLYVLSYVEFVALCPMLS